MKTFSINNVFYNYNLEFLSINKERFKNSITLIEFCSNLNIDIPHYCYNKNLSIAGNCRMCLVELKKSPKPLISCAISAKSCFNNGSEIFTNSPLVKKTRENIMEFLLLNHPLDCPVCDQGGECDLQDQSLIFGLNNKKFYNYKRSVSNKNLGYLIKTVMTRCIHCTRCIRFATEVAGVNTLGILGRGVNSEIGTYVEKTFESEISCNIIDLCPVGALTSKESPFISRNWELISHSCTDFSDGFGQTVLFFLKNNSFIKVEPNLNNNESYGWISDKTRFMFYGTTPRSRKIQFNLSKTLKEYLKLFYFIIHLSNHSKKLFKVLFILNNNITIELANLFSIFNNLSNNIELKTVESLYKQNFIENNFLTYFNKNTNIEKSNICFLLNLNSKYDGYTLNLNLKKRYLKGNFKIITLSSSLNLTFKMKYIGINLNNLISINEGNNYICQDFLDKKNPIFVKNNDLNRRKDFSEQNYLFSYAFKYVKPKNKYPNVQTVNSSISTPYINYVNIFKNFNITDFKNLKGIYLINTIKQTDTSNLKKFVELKLIHSGIKKNNTFFFQQNNFTNKNEIKNLNKRMYIKNHLLSKNLFETKNTFMSTEGVIKKNINIFTTKQNKKSDWQIVRKIIEFYDSYLRKPNNKIIYGTQTDTIRQFQNYSSFNIYANNSINLKTPIKNNIKYLKVNNFKRMFYKFKSKTIKIYKTKLIIWAEDFFITSKDSYSNKSPMLIKCSNMTRKISTNFETYDYIIQKHF